MKKYFQHSVTHFAAFPTHFCVNTFLQIDTAPSKEVEVWKKLTRGEWTFSLCIRKRSRWSRAERQRLQHKYKCEHLKFHMRVFSFSHFIDIPTCHFRPAMSVFDFEWLFDVYRFKFMQWPFMIFSLFTTVNAKRLNVCRKTFLNVSWTSLHWRACESRD